MSSCNPAASSRRRRCSRSGSADHSGSGSAVIAGKRAARYGRGQAPSPTGDQTAVYADRTRSPDPPGILEAEVERLGERPARPPRRTRVPGLSGRVIGAGVRGPAHGRAEGLPDRDRGEPPTAGPADLRPHHPHRISAAHGPSLAPTGRPPARGRPRQPHGPPPARGRPSTRPARLPGLSGPPTGLSGPPPDVFFTLPQPTTILRGVNITYLHRRRRGPRLRPAVGRPRRPTHQRRPPAQEGLRLRRRALAGATALTFRDDDITAGKPGVSRPGFDRDAARAPSACTQGPASSPCGPTSRAA